MPIIIRYVRARLAAFVSFFKTKAKGGLCEAKIKEKKEAEHSFEKTTSYTWTQKFWFGYISGGFIILAIRVILLKLHLYTP